MNLVLRHSVPIKTLPFLLFGELWRHCVYTHRRLHRSSLITRPLSERGNENNQYFIFSNGNRTHIFRVYGHTFVPLRHYWPQVFCYKDLRSYRFDSYTYPIPNHIFSHIFFDFSLPSRFILHRKPNVKTLRCNFPTEFNILHVKKRNLTPYFVQLERNYKIYSSK